MKRLTGAGLLAMFVLAGCTTTEEANNAMKSRFIGQSSDVFFSQYGAPLSSFALNNGGTVYRWRGGETTRTIPAEYKTVSNTPANPVLGQTTKTTTTVTQPNAGTTVTETRTTSSGISIGAAPAVQQVLVTPARTERLFCEAQITTDTAGIIVNVEATGDTTGAGFSLSRCAEVFGVK